MERYIYEYCHSYEIKEYMKLATFLFYISTKKYFALSIFPSCSNTYLFDSYPPHVLKVCHVMT